MDQTNQKTDQVAGQPPVPSQSAGGINKEAEVGRVADYVKESVETPEIHPQAEAAGVEVSKDEEPDITFTQKQAGISRSIPETVISDEPKADLLEDPKISTSTTKTVKSSKEARRWRAVLNLRQWLRFLFLRKGAK